jgi:HAD superfamily hydrolase (TIGR01509 family)
MILQDQATAHVVFDCDGTLIDSMKPFYDILVEILPKHLGREVTRVEVLEKFIPEWVGLLENLGVQNPSKDLIDKLIAETSAINLKSPVPLLYPGIKDCLEKLEQLGVASYIWTGRDRASAIRIFKTHGIAQYFTEMSFSDTDIPKPHPDGLERMLEEIPKSKMVLIGDSGVDIQGAKNFSIPCIAVDWEKKAKHADFLDFGAIKVVQETDEIVNWVKENLI